MPMPRRVAATLALTTFPLAAASPAPAAGGVFGGATSGDEAIVVETDRTAKRLRGAVVAWVAPCEDGRRFSDASSLEPVAAEPGFTPGADDLVVTRNRRGRFSGTQTTVHRTDAVSIVAELELSGRLRTRRASGTLAATATVVDRASGDVVTTCGSGSQSWSASRSPGRIFGGRTAQDEPVVARLDRKRRRLTDLRVGWETAGCQPPDRYLRLGEHFVDVAVRSRRFGGSFDESYPIEGGGAIAFAYELSGSVARRTLRGRLRVSVNETDAAGATTVTCDSGQVRWKAMTG